MESGERFVKNFYELEAGERGPGGFGGTVQRHLWTTGSRKGEKAGGIGRIS